MTFTWEHFLELAQELADSPPGDNLREAKLRSAISRAYYASLYHARAYYRRRYRTAPPGSRSGKEHRVLPLALTQSGSPTEEQAGDQLNMLRGLRREADYELSSSPDASLVSSCLHLARQIIETLET